MKPFDTPVLLKSWVDSHRKNYIFENVYLENMYYAQLALD